VGGRAPANLEDDAQENLGSPLKEQNPGRFLAKPLNQKRARRSLDRRGSPFTRKRRESFRTKNGRKQIFYRGQRNKGEQLHYLLRGASGVSNFNDLKACDDSTFNSWLDAWPRRGTKGTSGTGA